MLKGRKDDGGEKEQSFGDLWISPMETAQIRKTCKNLLDAQKVALRHDDGNDRAKVPPRRPNHLRLVIKNAIE